MKTILINDGLSKIGKNKLVDFKFNIIDQHIEHDKLISFINQNNVSAILVRSATKITKNIIDNCPKLELIGRGGVGLDNIDVKYATSKNIHVINTPSASSLSVAELVFAHLFSMTRNLYHSNRTMQLEGDTNFKKLKKQYSKGIELRNKQLGIIGFGRIGQEVAKIGFGLGMEIVFYDPNIDTHEIELMFFNQKKIRFKLQKTELKDLLQTSDMVSIHVPKQKKPLISAQELKYMKKNSFLINTSRGGAINEHDLLEILNSRGIQCAGLDVFEGEPEPKIQILMNDYVSLSPHIGASTLEAQDRIGIELAEQIKTLLHD